MKLSLLENERGVGHIVLIAAASIIMAVGLGGWFVYQKNDKPPANANTESIRKALKDARCDLDDNDLCKFFASWEATEYYTAKMTVNTGKTTNTTVVRAAGDRSHTKINAELAQETITIGNTLYTKDAKRNMWYKQATADQTSTFFEFDESQIGNSNPEEGKPTYKKLGKEKCGELTCFRYRVTSPTDQQTKFFLWFDDKDYQLRKQLIESAGSKTSITMNYDKVTIQEPSPYKELDGGEIYIPGQGVLNPNDIPDVNQGELDQPFEQYQ